MRVVFAILLCILALDVVQFADGYAVCGNSTYKADEVATAVDEIVRRFMALRSPNWGWGSVSTITTLQVAAPEKFFARVRTTRLVKRTIRSEFDDMHFMDLAEFSFVARSLCLNPRKIGGNDILEAIHDSMLFFVANTSSLEPEHVIEYTLAVSSLCINDYPLDPQLVEYLLDIQNKDGSFGTEKEAIDVTIFILRPVLCLTRMTIPNFNATRVTNAMAKMRKFIVKQVRKTKTGVYIGENEIQSNDALIGLWYTREAGEDPNTKWACSEVMETLGIYPKPEEDEFSLQERILRLTASDYLDMQSKSYTCLDDTDKIPRGYRPKCDYEVPETCDTTPK